MDTIAELARDAVAIRQQEVRTPRWQRTLRAIYVIWYRDLIRYARDRTRLVASLAQPLLFLVVFGVGLSSSLGSVGGGRGGSAAFSTGGASLSYIQYIYPGVVGMAVLFTAMFSSMSIVWDREFGFLKEILVAPIDRSAVAIGKALGGATQAMLQGLIMLAVGPIIGVHLTPLTVVEVIPILFLIAFTLTAFGVAIAARMRSMQGFQVIMNFLLMPVFFLSGSLFPLVGLPAWMTVLTRIDPVAYGIAPLRTAVLSTSGAPGAVTRELASVTWFGWQVPSILALGMLSLLGSVFLGVAIRAFRVRD
ncbi:MAG TPA: ABC transporter permease [Candidatus Angelobacter sp.]|jgi:ABC-2 type transport system permease protein|nr:ABC transporter permease [Candidatus Angelobacter sp.]